MQVLAPDIMLLDAPLRDSLRASARSALPYPGRARRRLRRDHGGGRNLACAEAGLAGFVGTDGTVEELVTAIERAMRGELLCPPRIVARLFDRVAELARDYGPADAAEPVLTRREQQIAQLIREGLSNKEIAAELRIGPATVKRYAHNLLEKFQVQRRSAIAARVR